jgi:hypothetical protein
MGLPEVPGFEPLFAGLEVGIGIGIGIGIEPLCLSIPIPIPTPKGGLDGFEPSRCEVGRFEWRASRGTS